MERGSSHSGMQDYIIPGAEWRNSLAPLTHLIPSIYFVRLPSDASPPPSSPTSSASYSKCGVAACGASGQSKNSMTQILWAGSRNAFSQSVMASFHVMNVSSVWSQGLWSDVRRGRAAAVTRQGEVDCDIWDIFGQKSSQMCFPVSPHVRIRDTGTSPSQPASCLYLGPVGIYRPGPG